MNSLYEFLKKRCTEDLGPSSSDPYKVCKCVAAKAMGVADFVSFLSDQPETRDVGEELFRRMLEPRAKDDFAENVGRLCIFGGD